MDRSAGRRECDELRMHYADSPTVCHVDCERSERSRLVKLTYILNSHGAEYNEYPVWGKPNSAVVPLANSAPAEFLQKRFDLLRPEIRQHLAIYEHGWRIGLSGDSLHFLKGCRVLRHVDDFVGDTETL